MFVLTSSGYINAAEPRYKLYKYQGIGNESNCHICIKTEEMLCYEITFLSGVNIMIGDRFKIGTDKEGEIEFLDIDKLKFGMKAVLYRVPDFVVEKCKQQPLYKSIIQDLIELINNKGKVRILNEDARHCDISIDWNKEKISTFVFSLNNIGLYIKIRKSKLKDNGDYLLTAESDLLNEIVERVEGDNRLIEMKKLINTEAFHQPNIDKERDTFKYEIIKKIRKLNNPNIYLSSDTGIDKWNELVIDGFVIQNSNY